MIFKSFNSCSTVSRKSIHLGKIALYWMGKIFFLLPIGQKLHIIIWFLTLLRPETA